MSEWVTTSEVSSRLGHKILIAGLSEAGKTAVKRIFFLKHRTEDVDSLSATLNYERLSITIEDTPITIVDLGGQKIFLKRFLSAFSPFVFSNVKVFIFLIDTANKTTRNNALQYFSACIEKLNTFSPDSEVFMFLHKNDLVRSSPNYESIHEQLKEVFQLEYESPIRFFRTTIYKPETVIDAFGRIFELVLPEIKQSEFVEGRVIGEIEEFQTQGMTLRDKKITAQPMKESKIEIISHKTAGDPVMLARLRTLMENAAVGSSGNNDAPAIFLGDAASEESEFGSTLTPVAESKPQFIPEQTPEISAPITAEPDIQEIVDTPDSINNEVADDFVKQIKYLVDFCRIDPDEATQIVHSGYGELFKIATSSGMSVRLLRDVFLKYLPFIRDSQGEKKFQLLTGQRLLDVFSARLKNKLEEEDMLKCLTLATENPKKSIDKIIRKHFTPKVKKKKVSKKKKPGVTAEFSKIAVPIKVESVDGIITLPDTQGISFKAVLTENGLNVELSFFLRGPGGQMENIGNSVVSANINSEEILYLLAYEMHMFNLGYFENGAASMAFSAKLIHSTIKNIKDAHITSTAEVPTKKIRVERGHLANTVDYLIPTEMEINGDYLIFPDTEQVAFLVEKTSKKGITISFTQRGYPIGQVNVINTITQQQIRGLLKEAMQLPIESSGAIDFAARMIKVIISQLVKAKTTRLSFKPISQGSTDSEKISDDDETSDELRQYLDLLEKD